MAYDAKSMAHRSNLQQVTSKAINNSQDALNNPFYRRAQADTSNLGRKYEKLFEDEEPLDAAGSKSVAHITNKMENDEEEEMALQALQQNMDAAKGAFDKAKFRYEQR